MARWETFFGVRKILHRIRPDPIKKEIKRAEKTYAACMKICNDIIYSGLFNKDKELVDAVLSKMAALETKKLQKISELEEMVADGKTFENNEIPLSDISLNYQAAKPNFFSRGKTFAAGIVILALAGSYSYLGNMPTERKQDIGVFAAESHNLPVHPPTINASTDGKKEAQLPANEKKAVWDNVALDFDKKKAEKDIIIESYDGEKSLTVKVGPEIEKLMHAGKALEFNVRTEQVNDDGTVSTRLHKQKITTPRFTYKLQSGEELSFLKYAGVRSADKTLNSANGYIASVGKGSLSDIVSKNEEYVANSPQKTSDYTAINSSSETIELKKSIKSENKSRIYALLENARENGVSIKGNYQFIANSAKKDEIMGSIKNIYLNAKNNRLALQSIEQELNIKVKSMTTIYSWLDKTYGEGTIRKSRMG